MITAFGRWQTYPNMQMCGVRKVLTYPEIMYLPKINMSPKAKKTETISMGYCIFQPLIFRGFLVSLQGSTYPQNFIGLSLKLILCRLGSSEVQDLQDLQCRCRAIQGASDLRTRDCLHVIFLYNFGGVGFQKPSPPAQNTISNFLGVFYDC